LGDDEGIMEHVEILVVYDSQTGNVGAMARAVADGAKEARAIVMASRVDDVRIDRIPTYDGFAFGCPTHCGTMTTKINGFLNHRTMKH
jgi:NAD(P)H dehydrogenase (quinone)